MATLDVFKNSVFSTRELTDAINIIPNMFGRIGEIGLFDDRPIRTRQFQIEADEGVLSLISATQPGTPLPGAERGRRKMRDFSTRRFGQSRLITADDVSGIRAFGSETELKQVADEVNDRLRDMRANIDITREYLRAGALAGVVLDPDGSTLVNLFTEFGITQKVVDFTFGTAGTDWAGKAREVRRHIELNLKGDMMTGVHCLCSPEFFDQLMANEDFRDAYKYYTSTVEPLRNDPRAGVPWQGITWEEYLGEADVPNEDGTTTTRKFIAAGDARAFPLGTRTTFRMVNSPADYMETVNTPGQPVYAKQAADPEMNRYVKLEAQTNTLPICMRPGVLVRVHSSN